MSVRLPTRRVDWRLMGRTARLVLGRPAYATFAVVVGGSLPLENRVAVLLGLYPFLGTSFSVIAGLALLAVSALLGVDLAMVAYLVREQGLSPESGGGSAVGALLGTLGAGWGACGPAVFVGLLSLIGASGALTPYCSRGSKSRGWPLWPSYSRSGSPTACAAGRSAAARSTSGRFGPAHPRAQFWGCATSSDHGVHRQHHLRLR